MSGIKQWLPFFETASEKRDTASWWSPIQRAIESLHLKVKMLVSDRAKGLIKLGSPEYLNVCSMPDLFHFNQDLAKIVGAPLGKAWKQAKHEWTQSEGYYSERKKYEDKYLSLDIARRYYQNGIHGIHKTVQPFNEDGSFRIVSMIQKQISANVTIIEKQAKYIDKEVQEKSVKKIFDQIPAISKGIEAWQKWTTERAKEFTHQITIEIRQEELQKWLIHYLLPVFIWEITIRRIHTKKKNERLIKHYKEVLQKARDKLKGSRLDRYMTKGQYQQCEKWAERVARTFQRSSSQVEGRNGYLAFVHKANRRLPEQRLKILTVVHNYDIRGVDNRTPAERLFDKEFPNLFEFVLENVTGFAEPRKRRV